MTTLRRTVSRLAAALTAVALLACAKPDETSRSADSTARNLTLAPTESTAALKDVPAPATEAAKPAPEKKAPVKKPVAPKPAAPAPLMLAAGTRVAATAVDSISTRTAKAGDPFTATVSQDVKDATGRVTKADAAKVAGGAVAGAIVGKLFGKNTKGAVIGGAAGAAAGAAAARASRDIDVVIPKGAAITIKLNEPLTVKAA